MEGEESHGWWWRRRAKGKKGTQGSGRERRRREAWRAAVVSLLYFLTQSTCPACPTLVTVLLRAYLTFHHRRDLEASR